jgi:hypothetical protein
MGELSSRADASAYVRQLEGWEIEGDPAADPLLRFRRRVYDADRANPTTRRAHVDAAALSPPLRRALAAFVLLGSLSPGDAGALAAEAGAAAGEPPEGALREDPRRGGGELARQLARIHAQLPEALDDPMTGVLAAPLHESLFPSGCGLLGALDRLGSVRVPRGEVAPLAYPRLYVGCRQTLLHLGLVLARALPALRAGETPAGSDFFAWWRTRWTQRVEVAIAGALPATVGLPAELPSPRVSAIARAVARLAAQHGRLATSLGRGDESTRGFVAAFVAELLDGAANLLLNERAGRRCPRPEQIEVELQRPHPHPTRARVAKLVRIEGIPFEDCFGRFFAAGETRLRLPRAGREITVWRLGTCPFPDYGFLRAVDEVDPPKE